MENRKLFFTLLPGEFAFCRLAPGGQIPPWATTGPFYCVTRSDDELSVFCRESDFPPQVQANRGWCCLKLEGAFDFSAVGVIASFARPLAEAGMSISVFSTYDTDYLLLPRPSLDRAVSALRSSGHTVRL